MSNVDEDLVKTINTVCKTSILKLTYAQIIKLFRQLAYSSSIEEQEDLAILRLMSCIAVANYETFYTLLESENSILLRNLIQQMDDASIYYWDKNNYTNFIGALCRMFKFDNRVAKIAEEGSPNLLGTIISLVPVRFRTTGWSSAYTGNKSFGASYNNSTGSITVFEQEERLEPAVGGNAVSGWRQIGDSFPPISPLSPVIVVFEKNELPLVQTALSEATNIAAATYVVPAIFLKYRSDKITKDAVEKTGMITLDLVTIYASGGIALATKVTWARRLWALTEVAGAVGNIGVNLNVIDTTTNYGKAVNYYNMAMGVIGITHAGRGLVHFTKNLPGATKILVREKGNIRAILLSNYLKWKVVTANLEGLTDAEKQLLTKHEQVWKMFSLADEGVSVARAFKEITINVGAALRNRINHITKIVFVKKGKVYKFTGCHSKGAIDELGANARIEITVPANAEGVYEAKVFAKGPDGLEIPKNGNEGKSTFFPDSWNENKILDEVEHAVRNNKGLIDPTDITKGYYGFSKNGKIKIGFYYRDVDGYIGSFFPILP